MQIIRRDSATKVDQLTQSQDGKQLTGRFTAMASPCEFIVETDDQNLAQQLFASVVTEVKRVEQKFSRYLTENIIHKINNANGAVVTIDAETSRLLDYADQCYQLSDGLFDITSGTLGQIWRFDGDQKPPQTSRIETLLQRVGWEKVKKSETTLQMPAGMSLDLGGIGKEYAADKAAMVVELQTDLPFLINLGGDIHISRPHLDGRAWNISVDSPDSSKESYQSIGTICVAKGGLTTSGDAHRHIIIDGVRYSHIINPKTGWPLSSGPRSVTVVANNCLEAGILSTMALLNGDDAHAFLSAQNIPFWILE